jgi:hypothetical protein
MVRGLSDSRGASAVVTLRMMRARLATRNSSDMTALCATASSAQARATSRRSSARIQAGRRAMI